MLFGGEMGCPTPPPPTHSAVLTVLVKTGRDPSTEDRDRL